MTDIDTTFGKTSPAAGNGPSMRFSTACGILFVLALGIRLAYIFEIKDAPLFSIMLGDAQGYDEWARNLASGDWIGKGVFFQVPLYPYLLGILYSLFGPDFLVVRCVQAVIGSLSCVCTAIAGHHFFSRKVGLVAGYLLAIYPSAIFFDGLIQKAVLGIFFMALLMMVLAKIQNHPKPYLWFICGLVLGAFTLVRANVLVLVPILVIFALAHFRSHPLIIRGVWVGWVCLGIGLMVFPVALRNKLVGGEFTLAASNLGSNLYMGNNIHANGLYFPLKISCGNLNCEIRDVKKIAEEEMGRELTASEAQQYWLDKTLNYIEEHPGHWVRLMMKKWFLVWNWVEIVDTEGQYAYEKWSWILKLLDPWFHFGILCPMAVLGMALTWDQRRHHWVLYPVLLIYGASVALFFIFARYRVPLVVILMLFSAAGIVRGIAMFKEKNHKKLVIPMGLALVTAIGANWVFFPKEMCASITFSNLATRFQRNGDYESAETYFRESLRLNPDNGRSHNNIGVVYLKLHNYPKAIIHFKKALEIEPYSEAARQNLTIAQALNDVVTYSTILDKEPANAKAHNLLGIALARLKRYDEAIRQFQEALAINPDFSEARQNLERAMKLNQGQPTQ